MSDTTKKKPGIDPSCTYDLAALVEHTDDSVVSRTLINTKSGSLTLFAFAEGQRLSEHTAPFDAFAHVIEGSAEIVIGGASTDVAQGQAVLMPANVPHAVNAKQNFKMMLTMFKTRGDA